MTINTLCIFGTRPEAIKMASVVKALERNSSIHNKICLTGQHTHMLEPMMHLFELKADFSFEVMSSKQALANLTSKILLGVNKCLSEYKPDLVLVHGDTTTAMASALAAFYHRIPVGHVEAGLRTGSIYAPWPEEANRSLIAKLAAFHFAPTKVAYNNLMDENIAPETAFITGNTVIDTLLDVSERIDTNPELRSKLQAQFSFLSDKHPMILVTGHRRENFGEGFENICKAIGEIAIRFPEVIIVYPVHLNPSVQEPVYRILSGLTNVYLIEPVEYLSFVFLMKSSYLILTDSGGIQEEAPSLGKPVLVMRDKTERPEAVQAGAVRLVGTNTEKIVNEVAKLLLDEAHYGNMSQVNNPYGDGTAASRIVDIIVNSMASTQDYETSKSQESLALV